MSEGQDRNRSPIYTFTDEAVCTKRLCKESSKIKTSVQRMFQRKGGCINRTFKRKNSYIEASNGRVAVKNIPKERWLCKQPNKGKVAAKNIPKERWLCKQPNKGKVAAKNIPKERAQDQPWYNKGIKGKGHIRVINYTIKGMCDCVGKIFI